LAIVTIHSYKGGTGKSVVSLNLAFCLSKMGKKVLLIESDIWMPSFAALIKDHEKKYFNHHFSDTNPMNLESLIIKHDHFDIILCDPQPLPDDKIFMPDQNWFMAKLKRYSQEIKKLAKIYDWIIFDSAPGYNYVAVNNLLVSDLCLTVIRSSPFALEGTEHMVNRLYRKARPKSQFTVFGIFNQVPNSKVMDPIIKEWKEQLKKTADLDIISEIHYSDESAIAMIKNELFFDESTEFGKAVSILAKDLVKASTH